MSPQVAGSFPLPAADSGAPVGRRTLARGLAWSVPVLVVAAPAPAFAASCTNYTLDWDTIASGSAAPASVVVGPVTVGHSIAIGAGTTPGPLNNTVQAGPKGGIAGNWVRFGMNNVNPGDQETITWTFSKPVLNLSFRIFAIDWSSSGGWDDAVSLSNTNFTVTFTGSNIAGSGTSADRWYAVNEGAPSPSQNFGSVGVRYAGPITTFAINYTQFSFAANGANTHIGLSDLAFCA